MLRMAHRILSQGQMTLPLIPIDPTNAKKRRTILLQGLAQGIPIIIADNVANYVNSGPFCSDDVPPCPPPFPAFFVEWNLPEMLFDPRRGKFPRAKTGILQAGMHVVTVPKALQEEMFADDRFYKEQKSQILVMFTAELWMTFANGIAIPLKQISVCLDHEYRYLASHEFDLIDRPDRNNETYGRSVDQGILMFTLAFMQCKNVERIDATSAEGPPPKWCRRQRLPELKYHTLAINPNFGKSSPGERKTEGDRSGKALHICRGHFMHSVNDGVSKGLFGRGIYGTFWVPAHVRGSADLGKVIPTYNVLAPTG